MRIDQHLQPTALGLTSRQHFFLSAWFNLVHQHSLDSYRVRVMNPLNILQELQRMFDPPADDSDRKMVSEEALEIFEGHPVLASNHAHYPARENVLTLVAEALQQKEGGFRRSALLIRSFMRELEASLQQHFLNDSFSWIENILTQASVVESPEQREHVHAQIQRVCRDVLSVAHDKGFSLESLFHLYRHLANGEKATPTMAPYNFTERYARVKAEIMASPKEHHVIFAISGAPAAQISNVCGSFGILRISAEPPNLPDTLPTVIARQYSKAQGRLFASASVVSRDGRSAGLDAYRQIGQILDLMRFEYDAQQIKVATQFILFDGDRPRSIKLPQLIPNPEAEPPTKSLEEFVEHLDRLAARAPSQTESRDRIFSAFRLYRTGSSTSMFENKLVNWWTGIEYLSSGARSGGIGATVKEALAPTLALTYLSKHLTAFRSALGDLDAEILVSSMPKKVRDCTNSDLYMALKDTGQKQALEALCQNEPHLWASLSAFIENLSTPARTAALLKAHDRRVRWQIERIYRARCDIVHTGGQVAMASLLCANLEFYLRMTLKSMLKVFASVPTLTGPAEFFERQRHQFGRLLQALEPSDKNISASDALLTATLDY